MTASPAMAKDSNYKLPETVSQQSELARLIERQIGTDGVHVTWPPFRISPCGSIWTRECSAR